MAHIRVGYMPLATYPEAIADRPILAVIRLAAALACEVHVTVFTIDIPQISSPLGSILIDIPGLVRAAEEKSKAEGRRLRKLILEGALKSQSVQVFDRKVVLGAAFDAASADTRYFDIALLPWSGDTSTAKDMAEAVVFGSGRPAILVPAAADFASLDHVAIAWDGSRVAARALGDVLPLLATGGRVTVLTVKDEKPLGRPDLAA